MHSSSHWPLINYHSKCIHILCIHGLGDVIRFALPLARSLNNAGAEIFLYVRDVLTTTIGTQPNGLNIIAIEDHFVSNSGGSQKAIKIILDALPTADMTIGLGGSFFDQEAAQVIQERGLQYWGTKTNRNNPNFKSTRAWLETLESSKTRNFLFKILGAPFIPNHEILINPKPNEKINLPNYSVGVHTQAMWPAKTYLHREELIKQLSEKYNVWNFDSPPCSSIANLAEHIKQSKAVLSVDTMIIHLCQALNIPSLLIQGPVWHHPDNIPNVIECTRTTSKPLAIHQIDKQSDALSKIPPEQILEAFEVFLNSLD